MHQVPIEALETALRNLQAHRGHREAPKAIEKLLVKAERGQVIMAGDELHTTLQRVLEAHGHDTMHVTVGRARNGHYLVACRVDQEDP